ncbi:cytochrome c biogenesis protein ResB [Geomonas nitrogeniifigens]|uniref:Cytochrome c biogenesis protein ResB n=1 Tax=Geomonas diazotrophica TaxID=2843197 RepID=A0ABX8JHW2_9BACT|nr:cytochrome c biogenesis protein ResB [Geomonas nitrogeniifigens]QWV96832.1 cytochrome c biogenesis protein ResB [Geomonas nitrogeniifigens]QXE85933.1 cytochrome c biogenesis protein ResB [Geomonas nitrogeniifigens]
MTTTNKRGFAQEVWDFFCSLKLSIFLLIGLALVSIIGTVIQQGPQREYLATLSETKIRLYSALGFFDMYHSWWFILLLYLLTLNLICCSIKRLPRVWKVVSEPVLVMDDGFEKSLVNVKDLKLKGSKEELKSRMEAFLRAEFAAPVITEKDGEYHLFAQKSPWCRLGVYVVHLSIIVIFVGALIGSFFGYKAYTNIPEGGAISQVQTQSGKMIPLGFDVRCEKFSVSFYDTGAPKEFRSVLTVLENGQPVPGFQNRPIIVNDPLTYKGITFYQSSYGQSDEGSLYHLTVRDRKGGAPVKLNARQGERVALPGGAFLSVMEATMDVRPFMRGFDGPGAQVEFTPAGGNPQPFVILSDKYESFNAQHGGDLLITFDGMDQKFYTGLQVAHDPGVWVVWFGCFLMVLGICMAFFMSHKRVWARVTDSGVTLGGSASKNPAGFEICFDDLVEKIGKA